jgi:hypothetical protein
MNDQDGLKQRVDSGYGHISVVGETSSRGVMHGSPMWKITDCSFNSYSCNVDDDAVGAWISLSIRESEIQ